MEETERDILRRIDENIEQMNRYVGVLCLLAVITGFLFALFLLGVVTIEVRPVR